MGDIMDFKTKEFTVLTPFSVVTKEEATIEDKTGDNIIKIAGMANFCGSDEFGKTYVDLVGDVVVPGGVDTSVWAINPQILWQHDREETIGAGILLEKRPDGIYIECDIHKGAMEDKEWYRVKSGLVKMFSVGFRTLDSEWKTVDGEDIYFITKCLLLEVSIVSIPANSKSSFSQIKSIDGGFTSSSERLRDESKGIPITNIQEDTLMNIKLTRKDLLSGEELVEFKRLGGNAEEEVEVALADFIKSEVAKEVARIAEEKAKCELAEAEAAATAKLAEDEAAAAEAAKLAEEAAQVAAAEEEKALADEVSGLQTLVETLKALAAEEK